MSNETSSNPTLDNAQAEWKRLHDAMVAVSALVEELYPTGQPKNNAEWSEFLGAAKVERAMRIKADAAWEAYDAAWENRVATRI